jgi:FtsH-binding integral membrane protein
VTTGIETSGLPGASRDRSTLSLIAANGVTIALALVYRWELGPLMWVYWTQSVVIGIFQFRRILDLKEFSTRGFKINDRAVEPTEKTKRTTAFFFLFHYNFFHFGYLVFLLAETTPDFSQAAYIVSCGALFFANHLYSYRANKQETRRTVPNIGTMMFLPYLRILPMHLVLIFAVALTHSVAALLAFCLLKIGADVLMHLVEHRVIYSPVQGEPATGMLTDGGEQTG